MSYDQRCSDSDQSKRDIPSFIEPRPPLVSNPFMRPRPHKGINLMELFEDSGSEEADWVKVYLRLKPCNVRNNLYEVRNDRCLITSVDTATAGHGRRTQHNISKMYTFSRIFRPESTQKEIFENVVKDNLKKLPEGHNFTLLTYGASGSGKTYTLMGTVTAPGLVPRSLEYVFRLVDAAQHPLYKPSEGGAETLSLEQQEYEFQFVKRLRQVSAPARDKYRRMSVQLRNDMTSNWDLTNRTRYFVWVSFIEIYNEAIYDLLTNCDRSKASAKLRIREDANGLVFVKGATQAFVRSGEEAYDIMVAGKHNLQVAATGVHANSSRSHCIFTITMLTETDSGVRASCVRLCDLAGSERAARTRNTGARMLESRAINTSLHVLERCLHMLRRKQRTVDSTLVPYRESKLTRLLGAGLSGQRGESVSMVVTLNPSPEFAHETRHVLQLAAVAKDIQVNQTTIAESTFESSTVDSSATYSNAELLKWKADCERLHYELAQAETRNKELMAAMEEKQQEVANTMFEIVEEAKDMTRQYYESQIKSLKAEMEEMQEEYEQRINQLESKSKICDAGSSCKAAKKVTEMVTEIALLGEQLAAERLARAVAEEEVRHLRGCIEERDEKARGDQTPHYEEEILSDSESEEEDPCNESLEPTFKKEDINRSRMLQRSILDDTSHNGSKIENDHDIDEKSSILNISDNNQSVLEKSADTLKDDSKDQTIGDGNETYHTLFEDSKTNDKNNDTFDANKVSIDNDSYKSAVRGTYFVRDVDTMSNKSSVGRGTYFVTKTSMNNTSNYDSSIKEDDNESTKNISADSDKSSSLSEPQTVRKNTKKNFDKNSLELMEIAVVASENENKSANLEKSDANTGNGKQSVNVELKSTQSDVSLDQFEKLEIATTNTKHSNNKTKSYNSEVSDVIAKANTDKNITSLRSDSQLDIATKTNTKHSNNKTNDNSEVSDVIAKPKTVKNMASFRSDSLAQFEELEKVANARDIKRSTVKDTCDLMSHVKIFKEKRTFFDDEKKGEDQKIYEHKDTYFDNNTNVSKAGESAKIAIPSVERSPSIIKDSYDVENYEPTTIKLFRESFTRSEIMSSVQKHVDMPKKQVSVDIFEGFDSPCAIKTKEQAGKTYFETESDGIPNKSADSKNKPITVTEDKSILDTKSDSQTLSNTESILKSSISTESASKPKNTCNSATKSYFDYKTSTESASKPITDSIPQQRNVNLDSESFFKNNDSELVSNSEKTDKRRFFTSMVENTDIANTNLNTDAIFKANRTVDSRNKDDYVFVKPKTDSVALSFDKASLRRKDNVSILDTCIEKAKEPASRNIESMVAKADMKSDTETSIIAKAKEKSFANFNDTGLNMTKNNTIDEFDNLFKDITLSRANDFELLVLQNSTLLNETKTENAREDCEKPKYNLRHKEKKDKSMEKNKDKSMEKYKSKDIKDNIRVELEENKAEKVGEKCETNKKGPKREKSNETKVKMDSDEVVILESKACESKAKPPKRNLRLRRLKKQDNIDIERDNSCEEVQDNKFKDIINLQKEFSDVTLDVPAAKKETKDIPSPEKKEDENMPPSEIQSCPSKSVTRSRRKLFTPLAEPLEESGGDSTGDANERVRVPRPSYHRARVRRKL